MLIKRRFIIALIITITILILSNKFWLDFKPMIVDFDIFGKGICNIEVQLNKKNNDKFQKIKTQFTSINLDKDSHIKLSIEKSRFPKRFRIIFNNINSPIEVKNITLKNGKYKLDNIKYFKVNTGKLSFNKNSILIYPPPLGNSVILTYNKKLNIRTSIAFDFKIFIVILVLTYLLAFKLTDYAADFKTVQNQSRIEIVFLSIFFIFLFVPISHINQDEISKNENRTLAKWSSLIKEGGVINYNFGKDYNNWFNDRFCLRQFLLDIHTKIIFKFTGKAEKGMLDKNGFLYKDEEFNYSYSGSVNEKYYLELIKFDKYLKEHNIELYVLLVPTKITIYPAQNNILINNNYVQNIDRDIKKLNEEYNLHIINPLNEIQEGAKRNYMFFRTENHWTHDGAFIGYKALMKEINKNHKDIYTLQENDFNYSENNLVNADWEKTFKYGLTSGYMNLSEKYKKELHKKTKYRYYTHKESNLLKVNITDIPFHKTKSYYYPKGADYRVILLGTSQNESMSEFIPYTFKNVLRLRTNSVKNISIPESWKIMKYHENEILDYKPNIIIFCIPYNEIPTLIDLFKIE